MIFCNIKTYLNFFDMLRGGMFDSTPWIWAVSNYSMTLDALQGCLGKGHAVSSYCPRDTHSWRAHHHAGNLAIVRLSCWRGYLLAPQSTALLSSQPTVSQPTVSINYQMCQKEASGSFQPVVIESSSWVSQAGVPDIVERDSLCPIWILIHGIWETNAWLFHAAEFWGCLWCSNSI